MSMLKICIAIVLIAAAVGIVLVALPAMGITLPDWVWKMLTICLVAAVACAALIFIFSWWKKLP